MRRVVEVRAEGKAPLTTARSWACGCSAGPADEVVLPAEICPDCAAAASWSDAGKLPRVRYKCDARGNIARATPAPLPAAAPFSAYSLGCPSCDALAERVSQQGAQIETLERERRRTLEAHGISHRRASELADKLQPLADEVTRLKAALHDTRERAERAERALAALSPKGRRR